MTIASKYTCSLTHHYRAQGLLCMQSLTRENLLMLKNFWASVGSVNSLHQYLVHFLFQYNLTRPLFRCKQCAEMDTTYPRSLIYPHQTVCVSEEDHILCTSLLELHKSEYKYTNRSAIKVSVRRPHSTSHKKGERSAVTVSIRNLHNASLSKRFNKNHDKQ